MTIHVVCGIVPFCAVSCYYFYQCVSLLLHLTAQSVFSDQSFSLSYPNIDISYDSILPLYCLSSPMISIQMAHKYMYYLLSLDQTHFPTIIMILTLANFTCLTLNSSLHITRSSYHQILEALKPGCYVKCHIFHQPLHSIICHPLFTSYSWAIQCHYFPSTSGLA